MRLKFYTIDLFLFAIITFVSAGVYTNNKGKYGYYDEERGIDIPCKYDYMSEFSDKGVAIVQRRNKWGCIDRTGSAVLKPRYLYISNFEDGFAKVSSENGLGLINDEGEFVLNPEWGFIKPFNQSNLAIIGTKEGKIGVVNQRGFVVCGFGSKISYYDSEYNKIQIVPEMDTVPNYPEYFYVDDTETFYYKSNYKTMYVSRESLRNILMKAAFSCQGNDVMPEISGWGDFQDGIVKMTVTVNTAKSDQIGVAIGYYDIKKDNVLKWIRFYKYKKDIKNGDFSKGTNPTTVSKFNHGYGCFTFADGNGNMKSVIVDKNGDYVRYFKYAFGFNKEGYMIVQDSITNKFGVVNSNFEYVIAPEYNNVKFYRNEPIVPPDGKFLAKKGDYWGEIDLNGNVVIPFTMKETFYSSADGLVGYSNDGVSYGLMRDNGVVLTSCKFKSVYTSLSPSSVCCKPVGNTKIYAYNVLTGDSTQIGYDMFVKSLKANDEHGGQIFILATKSYTDTTYTLIDGNLNLIVDGIRCTEEEAKTIASDESQKPFKRMSSMDIRRFGLMKSSSKRKYKVGQTISESDWDY